MHYLIAIIHKAGQRPVDTNQQNCRSINRVRHRVYRMKHMANVITCLRIPGSITLLFLQPFSLPFFVIYTLCGVTDIIDGIVARKTNSAGHMGEILDSAADIILIAVALVVFIPIIPFTAWMLYWIAGVVLIRISSFMIGYIKYRAFAGLHTWANKATGLILFCFPFIYPICDMNITAGIILITATLSAIEEMAILLVSSSLNRNTKSIFVKNT